MGLETDAPSDQQGEEDAHDTRRCVHKGSLLGVIAGKVADESGRVSGDNTAGDGELRKC